MVADDAECHVSMGEQLFGREASRLSVVTCDDADPWAGDRGVEGDDSGARRRGGSCVGLGCLGVGADDVEAARVFGLFVMYGSWAAARADGHDDGGAALAAACLEAGLGEGAAAQPFLRQHWGVDRGGHGY